MLEPIEFTITVNPDATVIQPENYVFVMVTQLN